MASLSQINQFRCKAPSVTLSASNLIPKLSISLPCVVEFSGQSIRKPNNSPRPVLCVRAVTDEDEWGPDNKKEGEGEGEGEGSAVGVAVAEEEKVSEALDTDRLKKALANSFYGTNRGSKATSETRAEIVELITQLEARNTDTAALHLLNGNWILAYTSFAGLFPLLSSGTLPLVKIKFDEGFIGTLQLPDSLVIPEILVSLAQKVDLTHFKGILNSVEGAASNVDRTMFSRPPLKNPISRSNAPSWLLTTYLDEELRISQGDGGCVFVLIKEGSSLLSSLC
ncbi:hypothetical protein K1719_032718 [Acacia pycnantha]|nr:hypothetical protein K1719_032718 [Acacia pycnantha]